MSEPGLKRQLGLMGVFSIGAGAMISSGLFILPALAYSLAGPAVVLAYVTAGFLVIPAVLANSELATAMPKAGGTYFFIERSLGSAMGVVGGISDWYSLAMKAAFALLGIGLTVRLIEPGAPEWVVKGIAVGFCAVFTAVNLVSVKAASRFQTGMVLGLLGILVLYLVRGFPQVDVTRFQPFFHPERGAMDFLTVTALVFISYGGLNKIVNAAEEVKNPGQTLPRAMILAFVVTNVFYVLVVFVTVGVLEGSVLGDPLMMTPISTAARETMGIWGEVVVTVAALLAFLTTANAGILTASRGPMAMSRDHLLPGWLGRTSKRFSTPHASVLVTSGLMATAIAVLPIELLVKAASTMLLVLFVLVNLALIVMRESRLPGYRPRFRTPLYPWTPLLGIGCYVGLLWMVGLKALMIAGGFLMVGVLWYLVYGRIRVTRQSALVRLVERATNREIAGDTLGVELEEILRHRDNIIEDRFDRLIRNCEIVDLGGTPTAEEAFKEVSRVLEKKLSVSEEELYRLLVARETSSSTVVRAGLAIPHVVVPGKRCFEMMVVRARQGVRFAGETKAVQVIFVLAGSRDERNYHLRALMAIAQIAQEPEFEHRWLSARNEQELRSILLLSNRERDVRECPLEDPMERETSA